MADRELEHPEVEIDLRTVTVETFPALGRPVPWRWRDKLAPDNSFLWPAVKLEGPARVTMMDGRIAELVRGDEIVQSRENPAEFGYVKYFAHELQKSVEPVRTKYQE